jgi:hypothetical protein
VGNDSGSWPDPQEFPPPPEKGWRETKAETQPPLSAFLPTKISLWEGLSGNKEDLARCQRLMPIILAPWEAEFRRIELDASPRQIVLCETQSPK